MTKSAITAAMREVRAAIEEADALSAKPEINKRDEQRLNVLLAKIAAFRSNAVAPKESRAWMLAFLRGQDLPEMRANTDFLAGVQSITYSTGNVGGYFVPQEFHDRLILGISQNDPFLDENVVTLVKSNSGALRPYTVAGLDLSTFAAVKIAEGSQQNPQTIPTVTAKKLGGYIYRATLDASLEFEEDDFENTLGQLSNAFQIGFARGIGVDLAIGNGTTAPQGILTGATDSGITTAGAGAITSDDLEGVYFKVDRAYRNSPKCAWAFSDTIYQQIRKAKDLNNRPLLNVVGDKELLMDKPIHISPSLPDTAGQRGIVFGDLSHLVVRVSRATISRNLQAAGYAEYGKALFTARMRADAVVIDPSGGNKPPIVYATLHA